MNFVFGRVDVDIDVLRGDLEGHVYKGMRTLRQVGAVHHVYGFPDGSGIDQAVVDEE